MSEVIGKATLEIGADASSLEAGFAKAGESVKLLEKTAADSARRTAGSFDSVNTAAAGASQQMDVSAKRFIASLERQADRAGKTASEYAAFRAQQLGVGDAAAPMIEKLRAAEQQFARTGVSAAQTAAAIRMVPAQMTDIVTQLAGGSNPLLVLTQQGGQLKDMFGGIGPALRGFGGYVAGLVNPFSVAAAAAAVLGGAMYKGSQESAAFNNALILTGNYAGKSAEQIQVMAARISGSIGTQGAATEALTQVAATGKIAGDQIEAIGLAALAMNKATGAAVDDTIRMFVSLGDEPSKASAKLNEQYHYLTDAVYAQIRALEEQGRKDEAAALAQKTLAEQLTARAEQVRSNLGYMERAWNSVASAAKQAWDYMVGLGRPDTLSDIKARIAETKAELEKMGTASAGFDDTGGGAAVGNGNKRIAAAQARLKALEAQAAVLEKSATQTAAESETKKQDAETIAARDRLDAQAKAIRTRAQQRKDELEQLKRDADKVGLATEEYNRRVAAIEEKYKDPKTAKPKAYQDDAATRILQQLRDQDAATRAALEANDKLTGAEKTQAEWLQKIADLKGKSILTAEQKSILAAEDRIKSQLELNVAHEKELKLKEDRNKLDERAAQINAQMASYQQSQREQYGRQLDAVGLGTEAQRNAESVRGIYREYERRQLDLNNATPKSMLGSTEFLKEQQTIRDGLQQSLQDYASYYESLKEKQGDWRNGALTAFSDYRASALNVAAQVQTAFGGAFSGLEDAVTQFTATGKASFGDFAKAVLADLVRIQARAAISGLAQMGISLVGSLFGNASTAAAYGTNIGSQQTAMLAAQNSGFADGGYTGDGHKYEPAGVVHRGEYVVDAKTTARPGVRQALESLSAGGVLRGYANGGYVGGSAGASLAGSRGGAGKVTVNLYGAPGEPEVRQTEDRDGNVNIDVFWKQVKSVVNEQMDKNMRGQGGYAAQIRNGMI